MKLSKNYLLLLCLLPLGLFAQIQLPPWYKGDEITVGYNLNSIGQDVGLAYTHRFGSNAALRLGVHLLTSDSPLLGGGNSNFDILRFKNRLGWDLAFQVLKPTSSKNVEVGLFLRLQYFRLGRREEFSRFTTAGITTIETVNLSRSFDSTFGLINKLKLSENSPLFLEFAMGIGLLTFQDSFGFFGVRTVATDPDSQDFSTDFGSLFHLGLSYRL